MLQESTCIFTDSSRQSECFRVSRLMQSMAASGCNQKGDSLATRHVESHFPCIPQGARAPEAGAQAHKQEDLQDQKHDLKPPQAPADRAVESLQDNYIN